MKFPTPQVTRICTRTSHRQRDLRAVFPQMLHLPPRYLSSHLTALKGWAEGQACIITITICDIFKEILTLPSAEQFLCRQPIFGLVKWCVSVGVWGLSVKLDVVCVWNKLALCVCVCTRVSVCVSVLVC